MVNRTVITAGAGILAATGLGIGAAALANASSPQTAAAGYSAYGQAPSQAPGQEGARGGGSSDTPVTGAELEKVKAAVKAKDSAVTVTSVRKDPDGSYDVFGTKASQQVMLEVSKDLKTITTRTGGPGGGHGGGPGHSESDHTPVTGAELDKVKAAVKAKDSAVTVTSVRKDPDGSYDVFGTKAGQQVMLEVSKDLKTVTTRTRGGDHGGPGATGGAPGTPAPSATTSGTSSSTT